MTHPANPATLCESAHGAGVEDACQSASWMIDARSNWSRGERASERTYVNSEIFLISAKSLLNNALLGFDSFYNAA